MSYPWAPNDLLRAADLTWNSGASANQLAEGAQQLARKNIVLR